MWSVFPMDSIGTRSASSPRGMRCGSMRMSTLRAILKSKSPSCGVNQVYDGSFSGTVIPGQGLTAAAPESN